ncbi:SusD/RagB family nutrient-binding outer membrane lipoprotein [Hymenobacter sp. CRA2]|uniref:SusD/RagB family nutrient-binding outer membrane lipoprotein n=1 Tax=Hymenobacter sp. CRA2 TaxID=1955620 RepID=UPI00098F8730|nr:SusD/RagB family nutrient-binding outer membrane lipoprotein [Hymenobacter sp. CRA2]OON69137.1 hypothetical protein B0919_10545 [Hymenobacter sp. CRA2]
MKNFSFNKAVLGGLLVSSVALASCEDFLDVNQNPNNPTEASATLVLPNAQFRTATRLGNDLNILGNLWTENWAQAQDYIYYVPQQSYGLTPLSYEPTWTDLYAGSLRDLSYVLAEAQRSNATNTIAIVKIMQAYNYQLLVDAWGDVPYGDALQGTDNLAPRFEDDQVVYDNIIDLLNEGIAAINTTAATPGSADIVFRGNMTQWRKFANTIKLRVYVRQSGARPDVARAGIQAMQTAGAQFLGADESATANPGFLNTAGKTNPLVANIGYNTTGGPTGGYQATRANTLGVNYLKATNDTLRLKRIYTPVAGRTDIARNYVAVASGDIRAQVPSPIASARLSGIGPGVIRPFAQNGFAQPIYLLSSAESFFLQAEAAERGWLTGGTAAAKTAYEAGITESFKILGVASPQAAATAYYSQTGVAGRKVTDTNAPTALTSNGQFDPKAVDPSYNGTGDKIEKIITQKWIANNGINGFESWNEYRRTGFPSGIYTSLNSIEASNPNKIPVRIPYPQTEIANNPNSPKGSTTFTPKVFWDVN